MLVTQLLYHFLKRAGITDGMNLAAQHQFSPHGAIAANNPAAPHPMGAATLALAKPLGGKQVMPAAKPALGGKPMTPMAPLNQGAAPAATPQAPSTLQTQSSWTATPSYGPGAAKPHPAATTGATAGEGTTPPVTPPAPTTPTPAAMPATPAATPGQMSMDQTKADHEARLGAREAAEMHRRDVADEAFYAHPTPATGATVAGHTPQEVAAMHAAWTRSPDYQIQDAKNYLRNNAAGRAPEAAQQYMGAAAAQLAREQGLASGAIAPGTPPAGGWPTAAGNPG